MSKERLIASINSALPSAKKLPDAALGNDPTTDYSHIRQMVDVHITNRAHFDEFVKELRTFPNIAALEGKHHLSGTFGGITGPIALESIAQSLLAQAILAGDPQNVVSDFLSIVDTNSCDELIIMSISDIEVTEEVDLGEGVRLLPLSKLQPSIPRGIALNQIDSPHFAIRGAKSLTALVTTVKTSPIIGSPEELSGQKFRKETIPKYQSALSLLAETNNCLALIDSAPTLPHVTWSQYATPAGIFIGSPAWSFSDTPLVLRPSRSIDLDAVKKLCAAYFGISRDIRRKVLHVPLDRLNRALAQNYLLVDRAIDLGIALEALLLHDISSTTELSYRFRVRGALLLETDIQKRKEMKEHLNQIYTLRSKAVHTGKVEDSAATEIIKGLQTCTNLIRLVIEKGGVIDFQTLELSGTLA